MSDNGATVEDRPLCIFLRSETVFRSIFVRFAGCAVAFTSEDWADAERSDPCGVSSACNMVIGAGFGTIDGLATDVVTLTGS